MSAMRKLALTLASVVIIAGVTFVAASAQGGKGFGCGPGIQHCGSKSLEAGGIWNIGPDTTISLSASQGDFIVVPKGGGTPTLQHETTVQISIISFSTGGIFGFGCFNIPDSQFVASPNLQSANLDATLTADEACPGFEESLAAANGQVPLAGCCFQQVGGIPVPLIVQVTWTGAGATFYGSSDNVAHCGGVSETFHSTNANANSNPTGMLTFPDGSIVALEGAVLGNVSRSVFEINTTGDFPPECFF